MAVHAGSLFIDANWSSLPRGLWVVANAQNIVAEDSDLNRLYSFLNSRGYNLVDVTIVYVPDGVVQ
ncbi:hypothetical protein GCM10009022_13890 [Vreelandella titanicae]|jgi:hypothetical protein